MEYNLFSTSGNLLDEFAEDSVDECSLLAAELGNTSWRANGCNAERLSERLLGYELGSEFGSDLGNELGNESLALVLLDGSLKNFAIPATRFVLCA